VTDAELRETTKPPEAAGAGQRLRHARETRQLSVEDVANALHLSARHIEALEHEDLNHLPDPSYICGYLRGYARYLDLPAEELLDHFPGISTYLAGVRSTVMPTKLVAPVEEAAPTAVNWSTPAMLVAAAVIMGWLVFQFGGLGKDGTPGTVPESPPVTPDNGPVAAVPPKPEAAAGTSEATVAQTAPAATNATAPATASAPTEPVPATAVQPATRAELTLEFNGDSWVEAQDAAGQRVLYELGKSGRTRNVSGQAPFRIILGAARNVSIRLNGDPVDMTRYRDRDLAAVRVGTAQDNR
jgi:cytoskeleton protein RodZ